MNNAFSQPECASLIRSPLLCFSLLLLLYCLLRKYNVICHCLSRISYYKELLFISHYCFSLPSYWLLAGCLVCLTAVCFLLACLLIAYYYYDISHQTVPCVCVTLYFVCTISIIIIACIFAYYLQRVSFFMVSWCSPSCLAVLICQEAARLEC